MSDSFFCYRFIGGASRIAVGFICTFICYSVQSCDNNKATAVQRGVVIIRPFLPEKKVPAFGVMLRPSTVRVNKSTGNVFILDEGNHRILEFGSGGDFIKQIGGIGQRPEQFLDPCDFDLDNRGRIYVVDAGNQRISILDTNGRQISSFPIPSFPKASILIKNENEILVNQPTIDGALFVVYNSHGTRVGSIGKVDNFETPPFEGSNTMATWAFNQVRARINRKGFLVTFYVARPLLRLFDPKGVLVKEKEIHGLEIDTVFVLYKKNLERVKAEAQLKPQSVTFSQFFTDFDFVPQQDGEEAIVRVNTTANNTFYEFDNSLNLIKTYRVEDVTGAHLAPPFILRFTHISGSTLVASDYVAGRLFYVTLN